MLVVTFAMLLILGWTVHRAFTERNRKLLELQKEASYLAKMSSENVSLVLESAQQMLISLASSESVTKLDGPASSTLFADVIRQSKSYLNIGLTQPDGLIIGSGLPSDRPVSMTDRAFSIRLQKKRDFAISDYVIGEIVGKPAINLGFPLPARTGMLPPGIVYASLDLHVLQGCISKTNLPENGIIFITDRKGTYVARYPDFDKWVGTKSRSWEAMEAKGEERTGFIDSTGADQIPRTYYYASVPGSDNCLFIAVGVSSASILAENQAGLMHELYLLGFCAIIALAAVWFLGSFVISMRKRVRQQTEPTRHVAGGGSTATVKVKDSTSELQQQQAETTARLAEEKRQAEEARHAEEKRWAEETRRTEEARLAEAARLSEATRLAEEQRRAEETRLAEAARIAEATRLAEEQRRAEETRLAEAARLTEATRLAEEQRRAEDIRLAEAARLAEIARLAEATRLTEQVLTAKPYLNVAPSINANASPNMNINPDPKGGMPILNQLAQSFESMSSALRAHNEQLERAVKEQSAAVNAVDAAWEEEMARHRQAEIALKARRVEHEQIIEQLQGALGQVNTIKELLPICNGCKKIRSSSDAQNPNGLCPDCAIKQASALELDRPQTTTKLNGFDAGAIYFADLKIDRSSNPMGPL